MMLNMVCPRCGHEWKEPSKYFVERVKRETAMFISSIPEEQREQIIKALNKYPDKSPLTINEKRIIKAHKENDCIRVFCRNCQLETSLEGAKKSGLLKEYGFE